MMSRGYHPKSKTVEHETPHDLFEALDARYHFDLDPCATQENAKCPAFYTREDDGLTHSWRGHSVYLNPPYGRDIGQWLDKAYEESRDPNTTVVALVPANTSAGWFHNYVWSKFTELYFIKHRLTFHGEPTGAPFSNVVVIYRAVSPALIIGTMDQEGRILTGGMYVRMQGEFVLQE